jgi:phosphomannomutase
MTAIRLKIGISGVRGVVGETLTPRLLCRFAQAFGSYLGEGEVLVGRDTRVSGPMVQHAVFAGLLSTGCAPIDLGVVPIPALMRRCATRGDARGAIAITASHNPAEWNALKLISGRGLFLSPLQAKELLDLYNQGTFRELDGREIPAPSYDEGAIEAHLDAVLAEVDVATIRHAALRVAVDCVNGAAAEVSPRFLERLGCQVIPLFCQPSGIFPRPPEPLPEHLGALREAVLREDAAIGFAQDADADRLAVVDEQGRALEGDLTLALLTETALERRCGPVVVNLSTSRLIEQVAARHGATVIRTPVGEANVVGAMLASGAVVGGEGSGGLIYPAVHACRDSFIAMALMLEDLARRRAPLSERVAALPPRAMRHSRLEVSTSRIRGLLAEARSRLGAGAEVDLRDGLRLTWPDRWLHLRPSNTEPILRLVVEADDGERADALREQVLALL